MTWKELIRLIESNHVIPVIGNQLYRVDIASEGKRNYPLYNYLAEVVSNKCKEKPPADDRYKFSIVSDRFLKENNNDHRYLTDLLDPEIQKIRLTPANPLLKLARIKSFNIFLNTTYDDFLNRILDQVRKSPINILSYTRSESQLNSLDYKTFKEIEDSKRNLIFHIFGTHNNALPAYTEKSLIETITAFNKDIEKYQDVNLVRKLLNSHLLFLGFEYNDWLFRYLINTLSSTALEKESFKLLIADIFNNKNSPKDPFQQTLQLLEKNDAVGFYPTDEGDGDFIDLLFNKMPDKVIPPKDFPGTVFISFEGKDRPAAQKLAERLSQDGISVWLDKDIIKGGERIDKTIIDAIDRCRVFIPLISKNSQQIFTKEGELKYHIREWEWAHYGYTLNQRTKIVPVILDNKANMYEKFKDFYGYSIPNGADGEYNKLRKQLQEIQDGDGEVLIDRKKTPQLIKVSKKQPPPIFIAHSSSDRDVVNLICSTIESNGIDCWMAPRNNEPGVGWRKSVSDAMEKAKIFLLVFSSNASESKVVQDEVDIALDDEMYIITFRIENVDQKGVFKFAKARRLRIDAYTPPMINHINKLIKAIQSYLKKDKKEN